MARKKEANFEDPNAWMVTFSDLLTLMLTFFVLLLSMSSLDTKALKETFSSFLDIAGIDQIDGSAAQSTNNPQDHYSTLRRSVIKRIASSGLIGSDVLPLKLKGRDRGYTGFKAPEYIAEETPTGSQAEGGGEDDGAESEDIPGVEFIATERGLIVRFPANITFAPGRSELKPGFKDVLGVLADTIKESSLQATVEGHTDDRPINTLRYPSNWELSLDRAAKVVRYLAEECQVDPTTLAATGYADRRPVATNLTTKGRNRNRRVDIILFEEELTESPARRGE